MNSWRLTATHAKFVFFSDSESAGLAARAGAVAAAG